VRYVAVLSAGVFLGVIAAVVWATIGVVNEMA